MKQINKIIRDKLWQDLATNLFGLPYNQAGAMEIDINVAANGLKLRLTETGTREQSDGQWQHIQLLKHLKEYREKHS